MIRDDELALIIGRRGCGKSTLSRALAATFHREIVFDRMKEDKDGLIVRNYHQFAQFWDRHHSDENFKVIIQLDSARHTDTFHHENDEILRVIYETGLRKTDQGIDHPTTLLLFEELQFYCTPLSILPNLKEAILTGRHAKISVIANTQRPANIHGDFKGNAHHVFAGQLIHKADVDYLKGSLLSEHAIACFSLPPYSFAYRSHETPFTIVKL